MKRWQWYTVAVFAGLVALEAYVYASPTPNNCAPNMPCRVRTLTVSGDATFSGDAGVAKNLSVNGTLIAGVVDAGTLVVTGAATVGSTAIPTCNAASERRLIVDASTGGTSGAETKLCMCTSDGAGSPTFSWYSILPSIAKGNASACP